MKRKLVWAFALIAAAGILWACNDNDNGNGVQPANEVWMTDQEFIPEELFVSPGTEVRWVNNSNVTHTVTSAEGLFDVTLTVNETFTYTFEEPGTYLYMCTLHPGMNASVTVE